MREVVLDELQGRTCIELETAEDREDLASAVQRSSDLDYYDSIAEGTSLAEPHARIIGVDPEELKQFHTVAKKRVEIADAIRRRPLGSSVEVLLHAVDSRVPPPMDDETREVLGLSREKTAEQIAKKWLKGMMSQENYLDKLLLVCERACTCVV